MYYFDEFDLDVQKTSESTYNPLQVTPYNGFTDTGGCPNESLTPTCTMICGPGGPSPTGACPSAGGCPGFTRSWSHCIC